MSTPTHTLMPDYGKPKWPFYNLLGLLMLVCFIQFLTGCSTVTYTDVPECDITTPPNPSRFLAAGVDERMVLMTDAYIKQVREVTRCNAQIRRINILNNSK